MHHAASKNFEPTSMFANAATLAFAKGTTNIHFGTGFSKWKKRRTETNLYIRAIHFFHKEVKCLFQIGERNIFINIQTLNLMKEAMTSCTYCFIAIYTTGINSADRQ